MSSDRIVASQQSDQLVLTWQGDSIDDAQQSGEWIQGTPMEIEQ